MSLYSLVLINIHTKEIKDRYFYLKEFSYFNRSTVKEFIMMISTEVADRIQSYDFQSFSHTFNEDRTYMIFSIVYGEHVFISCADGEYPPIIGKKFMSKCRNNDNVEDLLKEYQDPKSHNIMEKIHQEVKETKEISIKTLNSLLERNERLEDLVEKSEQLTARSKIFYKAAHKRNKCC